MPIRTVVVAASLLALSACSSAEYATKTPPTQHPSSAPHLPGLNVNDTAPLFALPDSTHTRISLESLTRKGPVVVVFYLGYSCPACVSHLRELSDRAPEFTKLNASIVAISPDTPALTKESIDTHGDFAFPLLADPNYDAFKPYGCSLGGNGVPFALLHGLFIVDRHNRVRFATRSTTPYDNPDQLLSRLEALAREK